MRSLTDILKLVRNGLAIYGGYCLLRGPVADSMEKRLDRMFDKAEDRINMIFTGQPKERPIEVEYEEVK